MGETTGRIVFVNSHDYVSVLGTPAVGCMVVLRGDGDSDVVLNTGSLRLQHTLEMAYATGDHRASLFVSGLALTGVVLLLAAAARRSGGQVVHA